MRAIHIILLIIIVTTIVQAADTNEITFIAMGHIYTDYDALNISLSLIEQENPDFVIFLGDSLGAPHKSGNELKSITDKISSPVYFAPGNHDIYEDGAMGAFQEQFSPELFFNFKIKGTNFMVLNTVSGEKSIYDISEEQVDFIKSTYDSEENNVIFMHHCLFYNYDNQFCNSRPYISENSWNKLVPDIQNKTIGVFVGDVGINEPYFGYEENEISYFGVGFSPEASQLKIPQHMLKATLSGDELEVTPIPIRQDLTKAKYSLRTDKEFFPEFKAFIKKNLALVLKTFTVITLLLVIIIAILLFKLFKNHKAKKSMP